MLDLRFPIATWEHTASGAHGRCFARVRLPRVLLTGALHALLLVHGAARAEWLGDFSPAGPSGQVRALLVHDGALVLGGTFTWCGDARAPHVGRWDGVHWSGIGDGVPFTVSTLVEWNGALVAGGEAPGEGTAVARWAGDAWAPLGTALDGVSALAVWEGHLVAAGWFDGTSAVVRLMGERWTPLGDGELDARARTLVVHDGRLLAGGDFTAHVAEWNGETWRPVGGGLDGPVHALLARGGSLVAGGDLGGDGAIGAAHVAEWTGTRWRPMGAGLGDVVRVLAVHRGDLVAGGWFSRTGPDPLRHVARWDGRAWQSLGPGPGGPVLALADRGGVLVAGGSFAATDQGGAAPAFVAEQVDGTWRGIGPGAPLDQRVLALSAAGRSLYAGGQFTRAGARAAARIARWDGSRWHALGAGVDDRAFALHATSEGVIAGGDFTAAGGEPALRIARWDGHGWQPLGDGLDGTVMAITEHAGVVVAGGLFTRSGTEDVTHLAQFDGERWTPFAGGANAPVFTLLANEGTLVVGGEFTEIGGTGIPYVARFAGASWEALGPALDGPVFSVVRDVSRESGAVSGLVLGGAFTRAGSVPLEMVARWDGADLTPVGRGLTGLARGGAPFVQALAVQGDALVAAGQYLAMLDGETWVPLGGGADGRINALATLAGTLYVGGSFERAGAHRSPYLAAWR